MSTSNEITGSTALICMTFIACAQQLHPWSAMGAGFGCLLFVMLPDPTAGGLIVKLFRKSILTIASFGIGYACGYGVRGSDWAMLAAIGGAALGSGVLGALNLTVYNNGPLPQWLEKALDRVPGLNRGTDGN